MAFPHIETIGCFARITNIKSKTVEELKQLRHFKFNRIHPSIIGVTSLTIFPKSDLYEDVVCGKYVETPEKERLVKLKTLIENLKNPTTILAKTISNAIPITGILPKDKSYMLRTLQSAIDGIDEEVMDSFRKSIGHL